MIRLGRHKPVAKPWQEMEVAKPWPEIAEMDSEHVRTFINKMADLLYINH